MPPAPAGTAGGRGAARAAARAGCCRPCGGMRGGAGERGLGVAGSRWEEKASLRRRVLPPQARRCPRCCASSLDSPASRPGRPTAALPCKAIGGCRATCHCTQLQHSKELPRRSTSSAGGTAACQHPPPSAAPAAAPPRPQPPPARALTPAAAAAASPAAAAAAGRRLPPAPPAHL